MADVTVNINPIVLLPVAVQSARIYISTVTTNFLEERISVDVQMGFSVEDDYNVQITRTAGGSEYRRLIHNLPVRLFKCQYIKTAPEMYDAVLGLYHRTFGRYAGFRAKVLDDFTTNQNILAPTAIDQQMQYISPTMYQLVKKYGTQSPGLSIGYATRILYKPVSGTTRVAIAGVEQMSGWSLDTQSGVVTFASAPVGVVTFGCEFDIPVRFDTAIVSKQVDGWRDTSEITLVELLNP